MNTTCAARASPAHHLSLNVFGDCFIPKACTKVFRMFLTLVREECWFGPINRLQPILCNYRRSWRRGDPYAPAGTHFFIGQPRKRIHVIVRERIRAGSHSPVGDQLGNSIAPGSKQITMTHATEANFSFLELAGRTPHRDQAARSDRVGPIGSQRCGRKGIHPLRTNARSSSFARPGALLSSRWCRCFERNTAFMAIAIGLYRSTF